MLTRPTLQMEGHFRVQIRRPDGRVRWDSGFYRNLILDVGLNHVAQFNPWCNWCFIGRDGTPPSVGQTQLLNFVARTSTIVTDERNSQVTTPPYYALMRRTFRFGQGTLTGNFSEVGVGTRTTSDHYFSRSLILDPVSEIPTTITPLIDEFVDVTWEYRVYPPESDVLGPQIAIEGETFDTTTRAAIIGDEDWYFDLDHQIGVLYKQNNTEANRAYDGTLGTVLQSPNGISDQIDRNQFVAGSYVNNSHQLQFSYIIPDISLTTFPIKSLLLSTTHGTFQTQFDNVVGGAGIIKPDTYSLTLNFMLDWGRRP